MTDCRMGDLTGPSQVIARRSYDYDKPGIENVTRLRYR
jgi:hypothetical protein